MSDPASAPRVHAETRADWRKWLAANYARENSVWLVSWRKPTGKPAVSYDDAVLEAVAVGWVDSKGLKLDDERTMLYFARRSPRSGWSRSNKIRVEQLRREGLMTPAGEQAIAEAQRNGQWSLLDDVENLIVPPQLGIEFERNPGSRQNWDRFPPSARRAILEWIAQAGGADTRARRISETARQAALNERANQRPRTP